MSINENVMVAIPLAVYTALVERVKELEAEITINQINHEKEEAERKYGELLVSNSRLELELFELRDRG